jgi:hypothetical protein
MSCWRMTFEGPERFIPTISTRTLGESFFTILARTSNYSSMTIDAEPCAQFSGNEPTRKLIVCSTFYSKVLPKSTLTQ